MTRKLSKSQVQSPTRRGKPQRKAKAGRDQAHVASQAQVHAKRTAAKHLARKASARFDWLKKPWNSGAALTFRVSKLDLELPVLPTIVFISVLGLAVGGGYWGAKSLFGGNSQSLPQLTNQISPPSGVIQKTHSLRGVILPEPNGATDKRAYEEKALEEVYEPAPEPKLEPKPDKVLDVQQDQVAKIPEPAERLEPAPPSGPQPLWMQNALAFTPPVDVPLGAPIIAIVIDDMGVDRKRSQRMWRDVPGPLTLSFMSYADDLPRQTQAARSQGHELMLHMSMEPSNAQIDAGPNVLLRAMPATEIRALANWGMDRFEGFVGVNNHMGSRFTEDEPGMRAVLEEINKRGLFFLDSRTSGRTVGPKIARELGMPMLERNVFLDNDNVPAKVLKQLGEVERLARKHGQAIAIGHPRDATIEVLKTWMLDVQQRGIVIVPVTTVLKNRLKRHASGQAD
ncbi:MAG: divergent polysaccharide deacetylase family protein [Magnetovibrio sp.]|nr:divergent polysaccharide deacetylase family protein [Magnetovibrio sp.]